MKMRLGIAVFFTFLLLYTSLAIGAAKLVFIGAWKEAAGSDAALINAFEAFERVDLVAEYHSQIEDQPVDLSGADLVFVYESVSSGEIGDAYRDASIPVMFTEHAQGDDMGMTPATGGDLGDDTSILIKDSDHPITQGFEGEVVVWQEPGHDVQGIPNLLGDVQILAAKPTNSGVATVFVYEKGAQMMDDVAPARRVFLWMHSGSDPDLLTADAWTIIERAFVWALDLTEDEAVNPEDALSITWGRLKAQ